MGGEGKGIRRDGMEEGDKIGKEMRKGEAGEERKKERR